MGYIYKITNNINQKSYIGLTYFSVEKRWKEHISDSKKSNPEKYLYRAMQKYGIENFSIEVIEECNNSILMEKEIYYIEKYETFYKGYNQTLGGEGSLLVSDAEVDLMIQEFHKVKSIRVVSKNLNRDVQTISNHLKSRNIDVFMYQSEGTNFERRKVYSEELDLSFDTISEAAQFLIDENYTKAKHSSVMTCISRVVNGNRKTYLNMTWESM